MGSGIRASCSCWDPTEREVGTKVRDQLGNKSGLISELKVFLHCSLINISKWKPSELFFTC